MSNVPLLQLGKRTHKAEKERAQGHTVNQWQNQDPAELNPATAVTPEQTSSSQQDNYYTIINIREFYSSFLTSDHWRFRM